jgi:quinol monooxygenase YgiN
VIRKTQRKRKGEEMIVVTGSVTAREETFNEVRKLSLEHVHRSRNEPGCISHAVHVDCEDPLRLVFIEQWADRAALLAHFAVPASRDFVRALQPLAAAATTIQLYDATQLEKLWFKNAWLDCHIIFILQCNI